MTLGRRAGTERAGRSVSYAAPGFTSSIPCLAAAVCASLPPATVTVGNAKLMPLLDQGLRAEANGDPDHAGARDQRRHLNPKPGQRSKFGERPHSASSPNRHLLADDRHRLKNGSAQRAHGPRRRAARPAPAGGGAGRVSGCRSRPHPRPRHARSDLATAPKPQSNLGNEGCAER